MLACSLIRYYSNIMNIYIYMRFSTWFYMSYSPHSSFPHYPTQLPSTYNDPLPIPTLLFPYYNHPLPIPTLSHTTLTYLQRPTPNSHTLPHRSCHHTTTYTPIPHSRTHLPPLRSNVYLKRSPANCDVTAVFVYCCRRIKRRRRGRALTCRRWCETQPNLT